MVVTAYHRTQFLPDALRSLLGPESPGAEVEIIVLKDFADATIDGTLSRAGLRVRGVTEPLGGMGAMFARGIELAHGDVIAFLEDDDRFLPGKVSGVVEAFRSDPDLVFLRNSYRGIDSKGQRLPSWDEHRPQAVRDRTIESAAPHASDLAFVFQHGAHVNLSTMAIRTDVVRPWVDRLREITAVPDLFLFAAAALSGRRLLVSARVWSEYRVHQSTSHADLDGGPAAKALAETVRSFAAAGVMEGMLSGATARPLADRFVRSFSREVAAVIYLLDPDAHWSFGAWADFVRTILWRRQRYLIEIAVFAVYRAIAPQRAVRAYRRRRSEALRRAAGTLG